MASEHWCAEHQTVWFKKGGMKGYAHPILDSEGEPTGGWCNEPKETAPPKETKDTSTNSSIEAQVAIKAVVELWIHDRADDQLIQTAKSWIMSKLGNWASIGSVEESPDKEPEKPKEKMIQPDQVEQIKKSSQKYKGNTEAYLKIMKETYKMTDFKKLNHLQAEHFIKLLESGKYLEKLEPEDIPF